MDVITELERVQRLRDRENWNAVLALHRLPVLSSREIGTVPVNDHPFRLTKVVVYRRDPVTFQQYRHGEIAGWGYRRPSKRKPRKEPCFHPQLISEELDRPLVFTRCPDCGEFLSGWQVVSLRAVGIIRANEGLWKDKKRTPIRWSWQEREGGELEFLTYTGVWTDVRFPSHYRRLLRFDRSEGWTARVAPEIDQRRLNAAWPYVLSSPDFYEYRAPYAKVRELRDAGFSIAQMARKLKVSERTINNRLADVPETTPPVDRLALRVAASGGHNTQRFWPGVERIPQGSSQALPSKRDVPTKWTWLAVPLGVCTLTENRLGTAREKRGRDWLRLVITTRLHAPYDSREENLEDWKEEIVTRWIGEDDRWKRQVLYSDVYKSRKERHLAFAALSARLRFS